jgi:GH15 family glucan-1,4-alpha-glucosidase
VNLPAPQPAGAVQLDEPARPTGPGQASREAGAYPPIADHAMLSDCHSAALVSRDGSIDWCCFHRFDARPVFARLLDWSGGGHFRIAPTQPATVRSRSPLATRRGRRLAFPSRSA